MPFVLSIVVDVFVLLCAPGQQLIGVACFYFVPTSCLFLTGNFFFRSFFSWPLFCAQRFLALLVATFSNSDRITRPRLMICTAVSGTTISFD
jgi:hypothetical protein